MSEGGELPDPEPEIDPSELPGPAHRPISVAPGTTLRDEARSLKPPEEYAEPVPVHRWDGQIPPESEVQARSLHRVTEEWRRWMLSYRNSHIEFESPDGETVRTSLQNSYQEGYSGRYYARIKDFERATEREFGSLTTVMLTLTASHRNAEGHWRCPADHMRDVIAGWDTARKELHRTLEGYRWEYARILEPHDDGYGHLHIGVFVDDPDDELTAGDFRSVMDTHVRTCSSAGIDAHRNTPCENHDTAHSECPECDTPISVIDNVNNLGSYLSEYIGIFGSEALDRPLSEQAFYAISWATNTRRLDFSNGAQELIAEQKWRRETGLRPCDRGRDTSDAKVSEDGGEDGGESGDTDGSHESWSVTTLCEVRGREPDYYDPTAGGVEAGPIDGRDVDPPKDLPAPPPD